MIKSIVSLLGLLMFAAVSFSQVEGFKTKYTLQVQTELIAPYTVDISIETNLPDDSVLSVKLGLQGQEPEDTYIGTDFERVIITDGLGHVTIDGNLRSFPTGEDLPPGIYEVTTTFYPKWRENRSIASKIGVVGSINEIVDIQLGD